MIKLGENCGIQYHPEIGFVFVSQVTIEGENYGIFFLLSSNN